MKSILIAFLLVLFSAPAIAQNGAEFFIDFDCGMGPAGFCIAGDSVGFSTRSVLTPSGNVMLSCNCFPTNGKPEETTIIEDVGCNTLFGYTEDTHLVWSMGGRASLTCLIHPEDLPQED